MQEYKSVFERNVSPLYQAGIVFLGGSTVIGVSYLLNLLGLFSAKDVFPWEIAFSGILFFALFNALFGLTQKENNTYFLQSIISYACLVVLLCLVAWLVSGLSIDEAGSFRWILIIFTFSYLLIVSISNMMKFVVKLAQKQDGALRGENDKDQKNK